MRRAEALSPHRRGGNNTQWRRIQYQLPCWWEGGAATEAGCLGHFSHPPSSQTRNKAREGALFPTGNDGLAIIPIYRHSKGRLLLNETHLNSVTELNTYKYTCDIRGTAPKLFPKRYRAEEGTHKKGK